MSASTERVEFRVVWKRDGLRRKTKRFATVGRAERFMTLFGPEPWAAYPTRRGDVDPDALYCCSGRECGCGGLSIREHWEGERATMPKLEYLRLETRPIGEWCLAPPPPAQGTA